MAGNFRGIQFLRKGDLCRFRDLIFADGHFRIKNVRLGFLFPGFNFCGLPLNRKNFHPYSIHNLILIVKFGLL